tara:strand:- start:246 stop:482 length:237 start_codon:yes stop_codon:yes gene_type:complete
MKTIKSKGTKDQLLVEGRKNNQWKLQELLLNNEELKWLKMVVEHCKNPDEKDSQNYKDIEELERKFNTIIEYRKLLKR